MFVNIDQDDKLVVILLTTYSIGKFLWQSINYIDWFYPFEKHSPDGKKKLTYYKEKKIMIDGKTNLDRQFTNIYDASVSSEYEVELLVFSGQTRSLWWVKRDIVASGSFKWSSNFWIYIIMYIHIAALLLGFLHFFIIMHSNSALARGGKGSQS